MIYNALWFIAGIVFVLLWQKFFKNVEKNVDLDDISFPVTDDTVSVNDELKYDYFMNTDMSDAIYSDFNVRRTGDTYYLIYANNYVTYNDYKYGLSVSDRYNTIIEAHDLKSLKYHADQFMKTRFYIKKGKPSL